MTMKIASEKEEAIEKLRDWIKPGDTVYTILRHVSASGMTRAISPMIQTPDGPSDISWAVGRAMGYRVNDKHGGLIVSGCGMDMGFNLVYNLASVLFPDGFDCIGEHCPSNEHFNGDRNYSPDHKHTSGGYALRHKWL